MLPKFTLAQAYASYNKSRKEWKRYEYQLQQIENEILLSELPYVQAYNDTPVEKLSKHLGVLDYSRLEYLLQGKFYNPDIMNLFSRILLAIYHEEKDDLQIESIHHYLKKVETLSEGENGITLEATLLGMVSPEVVVKFPKIGSLIHEIFVGLYGTNRLREYIPNFSFVYGGFSCRKPLIVNKHVLSYCNKKTSSTDIKDYYALYEDVKPAVSLADLLSTLNEKEFLNLYFQTILAEQLAYEQIGFTHFDLHPGNLLIRELAEEVVLLYPLKKGRYYLRTKYIATFIDYGYSSIIYKGKVEYIPAIPLALGLGEVSSFPLYDAFRLLAVSYLTVKKETPNNPLLTLLDKLLAEFTYERGPHFDDYLKKTYQALPTIYSEYSLQPLIDILVEESPTTLVNPEGTDLPPFYCGNCKDISALEKELYLTREEKPEDLFQLYYFIATTGNLKYLAEYPTLKIYAALDKLKKSKEEYIILFDNPPSFQTKDLKSKKTKDKFYYFLASLAKIQRLYEKITFTANILLALSDYIDLDKKKIFSYSDIPSLDLESTLYRVLGSLESYNKSHPNQDIEYYIESTIKSLEVLNV